MARPLNPSRRGSKPFDGTLALRKKLKADQEAGQLRDSAFYTKWLLEQDESLGRLKARRIVYREIVKYRPDSKPAE